MDRVFMQVISQRISSLHENGFQDFVDYLYATCYGTNFTPIQQKHDKGCDGLLTKERTVISVYAPQTHVLAAFKKKAADDFSKYKSNWEHEYPNWQFIYNGTLSAESEAFLRNLKAGVEPVTTAHLLKNIERLSWSERRQLARRFGVDEQFLIYNILDTILDDLLARADSHGEMPSWQSPVYVGDKIILNYCTEDIETAKSQHAECMSYFGVLQRLLAKLTDSERSSLKSNVIANYMALAGEFPKRVAFLVDSYSADHRKDDLYVFFVRVVLLFLFEQCIIGRRTAGEMPC